MHREEEETLLEDPIPGEEVQDKLVLSTSAGNVTNGMRPEIALHMVILAKTVVVYTTGAQSAPGPRKISLKETNTNSKDP